MSKTGSLLASLFLLGWASQPALGGEAYKCRQPDGQVVISDSPCAGSKTEKVIQVDAPNPATDPDEGQKRNMASLDARVAAAIASGDLTRARALAVSAEHWKMIADAEKNRGTPATGRTAADLRAEKAGTRECQSATRAYEFEASSGTANLATLDARRQAMNVACGLENTGVTVYEAPPVVRRPVYINNCIIGTPGCPAPVPQPLPVTPTPAPAKASPLEVPRK